MSREEQQIAAKAAGKRIVGIVPGDYAKLGKRTVPTAQGPAERDDWGALECAWPDNDYQNVHYLIIRLDDGTELVIEGTGYEVDGVWLDSRASSRTQPVLGDE